MIKTNVRQLLLWSLPTIIFIGFIGNTISFIVLISKRLRSVPVYFFLSLLAISDNFVLLLSAFKTYIRILTGFEMLHLSKSSCILVNFFNIHFQYLSSWFLVFVTFDRCVAVCASLKSNILLTIGRARFLVVILNIIVFTLNGHLFVNLELLSNKNATRFVCHTKNNWFTTKISPMLKLWTYSLIPIFMVLCMNTAIIYKLLRGTAFRELRSNATLQKRRRNVKVVIMLLTVSLSWIVLTCPLSIWPLVADRATAMNEKLTKASCFILMYLNHATNFIFYCLNGNKFRKELKQKFNCKRYAYNQQTIHIPLRTLSQTGKAEY